MAWREWKDDMPVILVGVENGVITETAHGSQEFESLAEAQKVFPDLDPMNWSKRFTSVMSGGKTADGRLRGRFETREAERFYGS